jgi:hypothetical protein
MHPQTVRRVVRGGAFNNNSNNARCAYRNNNNPQNRNNNIGFRVVVVSSFSRSSPGRGVMLLPMPEMRYVLRDLSPRPKEEWRGAFLAF